MCDGRVAAELGKTPSSLPPQSPRPVSVRSRSAEGARHACGERVMQRMRVVAGTLAAGGKGARALEVVPGLALSPFPKPTLFVGLGDGR